MTNRLTQNFGRDETKTRKSKITKSINNLKNKYFVIGWRRATAFLDVRPHQQNLQSVILPQGTQGQSWVYSSRIVP